MPFLRHGIISSVHPFPCPNPHGFTIDALSQAGASGSPIILADSPAVVGMLYAAFEQKSITYALPSGLLEECVRLFLTAGGIRAPTPTLAEWQENRPFVHHGRPVVRVDDAPQD